jgi:hypothetical protein
MAEFLNLLYRISDGIGILLLLFDNTGMVYVKPIVM